VEKLAFYMDCGGGIDILTGLWCRKFHSTEVFIEKFPFYRWFWWRNFHCTEVFIGKLALYRGFGGEIKF